MKITLDQIKTNLAQKGWKVNSTEYINLTTDMEFECPKGHVVKAPYKKIRDKYQCPICSSSQLKKLDQQQPVPKSDKFRILALDQATRITGWSLWDGKTLLRHGVFETKSKDIVERLIEIRNWLARLIENFQPDLVILEDIQYQEKVEGRKINHGEKINSVTTYRALAELSGVLQTYLRELDIKFELVLSGVWRAEVGVKGATRSEKKKSAQKIVKDQFDIDATEDEADAICIGEYATQRCKPIQMFVWE